MFSRGTATEVTNLVTSSVSHSISVLKRSSAIHSRMRSSTVIYDEPYSVDSPIASSTLCPTRTSLCWPAFTVIAIQKSGKVDEKHNNRLKQTARGRPTRTWRLYSRAAAWPER